MTEKTLDRVLDHIMLIDSDRIHAIIGMYSAFPTGTIVLDEAYTYAALALVKRGIDVEVTLHGDTVEITW